MDEVPTEGMEKYGVFTENSAEGFHEKTNQSSDLDQRNISSNSLGEAIHVCTIRHDKDSLLEGKAYLKCSCTTCTLIVLKRSLRKDDDFKRSNKYVFFLRQNGRE